MGGKGPEHWWGGLLGGAACLVGRLAWWGGLPGGAACLVGASAWWERFAWWGRVPGGGGSPGGPRAWWGSLFREALRSAERLLPVVTGVVLSGVSPLSNRLRDNWRVNKVPMPGRRAATRLV
ncbi:hypothetical protein [Buchananella hordeovulneris]|uniref:hypothetical protein n=1 Tax=Buchananella hordeovulneris TaxID=52770 RepID=UPI000F5FA754|nr:hypothetical protein [Buchananella hordeovulneris]RRD44359.1 hypothetical protein EII13_04475 [Buchananella hordeovulneris]